VRQQLTDILSSGRMPHAFLFAGPKGLGKTSAARILAKAINCTGKRKADDFEPCNKCDICLSINNGSSLDLIEIDAASNRGIDDIRQLRERIKLAPSKASHKVYVIDEVHMLTTEAFNALLKTLEEPPEHAFFILCTTEVHKLPDTILSRCLRLNFRKASTEELIQPLKRIERAESLKVGVGVLPAIAKHADGCFRDAVKMLEQLSFTNKEITLKEVKKFFGEEEFSTQSILAWLKERKTKQALEWLADAMAKGVDLKILTYSILETLRKFLLFKYDIAPEKIDDHGLTIAEIKELIALFDKAARQLKGAVIPQLPLEIAIIEWGENRFKIDDFQPKADPPRAERFAKEQKTTESTKIKESNKETEEESEGDPVINGDQLAMVLAKWPQFLHMVKSSNHSVEALLKAAKPIKLNQNRLFIEVLYPFHKGKLESHVCLTIAESSAEKIFGQKLKIKYVLKSK
jgi:DNA polymerase-3 subunit gamma/tau